jgi:ankyrin repeat protein
MRFVLRSSLLIAIAMTSAACSMFWEVPSMPLHDAAWTGDIAEVRQLVAAGADVNAQDDMGATALHWAARGGHRVGPHQCTGEAPDRPEVVDALLQLGADPNIQDRRPKGFGRSSGWTPLFVALHHEQFGSARVLLEHGADPNIKSDQGLSVMEMAAAEGAPRALVALLLEKGFDPQKAARRHDVPVMKSWKPGWPDAGSH